MKRYIRKTRKQVKDEKNIIVRTKMETIKKWRPQLDLQTGNFIWDCMFNYYHPNWIGWHNQRKEINKIKMAMELRK